MKRIVCFLFALLLLSSLSSCFLSALPSLVGPSVPIYDQMLAALEAGEKELRLRGDFTEDTLKECYRKIRSERPDLFWLGSSWEGTIQSSAVFETTAEIRLSYYGEKEDNLIKRERLLSQAKDIAKTAKEKESLYESLLYIHDEILRRCHYDEEAARAIELSPFSSELSLASTAYGCLMEGKAVCSGYSAAFALVLQQLSVPCRRITGTADGRLHEWNLVQVEGAWCHVDLTWDDPVNAQGDRPFYDYFCITDDEILLTHLPDGGQDLPDCDYSGYDWFVRNGMTLEECTLPAVADALRSQQERGLDRLCIKFSKDPAVNVYRLTDSVFLQKLQRETQLRLESYRVNSLNSAVEFFLAAEN